MASVIRIKRSSVSGNPTTLAAGELAYSGLANNGSNGGDILYIGMGTETAGNAANHVVIGGKYFTDMVTAATNLNTASTIVKRDASGNFSAGTITASLTGTASSATALVTGRTISLTGDVTYTSGSFDGSGNVTGAATLATVNSNVGSFGSSSAIPVITVNAKGLITAVSTAAISTTLNIAGGTGTAAVALGTDTLTFTGGTGITTTAAKVSTADSLTIAIDTAVVATLSGTQTLTNKTISGSSNTITNVSLTTGVTGTLPVANGGTGTTSGSITGTGALTFTAGGSNTNVNLVPQGTGIVDVGGKRVGNAADPTQSSDLATKAYVDGLSNGLDVKASVRAATTANITLSNTQTIDGVALSVGDRVLVKDQTVGSENGIYVVSLTGWTRAADFDNVPTVEVTPGTFFFVEEGTTQGDNGYVVSNNGAITIGTTAIVFSQFSGAGQITAGAGLTKSGNTIDVVGTANRITVATDSIDIASTYVGQASITTLGTIGTGTWQGSVIGSTYGGTGVNNGSSTLTLGGSVTHSGAFTQTFVATGNTSVTLPTTGTLATLAGAETLTNKTLTSPVISTISNTGTLTLPTSTDTLVGRATTDTLTNKTLTSPVISGGTINNAVIGGVTAAAGSFTTLSASGTITASGNITGAGAATSTLDGFNIDGGTY